MSEVFFAGIQKRCLPGVWSKGVALARAGSVRLDSESGDEMTLRVREAGRAVSPLVSLWPEDEDCHCDCGDRNEVCAHIAAVVIFLRARKAGETEVSSASPSAGVAATSAASAHTSAETRVAYRLARAADNALKLERIAITPKGEHPLAETLVALAGGIQSGRIAWPPLAATREDFALDAALGRRAPLGQVIALLARCSGVTLDGQPVRISARPTGLSARVSEEGGGFRLCGLMDPSITEVFAGGVALCGAQGLRPLRVPKLSSGAQAALTARGVSYRTPDEIIRLVTELLPEIEPQLPVELETDRLPTPRTGVPKIKLRLETAPGAGLAVFPSIDYPDTPADGEILVPNPAAEAGLARKLQSELHLSVGRLTRFEAADAVKFVSQLSGPVSQDWLISGEGARAFALAGELEPEIRMGAQGFELSFFAGATQGGASADPTRVLAAWREGAELVPLVGGGFAKLPREWLERHGARVARLLAARDAQGALPRSLLPALIELGESLDQNLPDPLIELRERLTAHLGTDTRPALPEDLRAELRDYQLQGVAWLGRLRDLGMGAMLADDMGLGKTLQALCAIRGRTLVVCPTSVLSAWSDQVARFRPGLKACVYHGSGRAIDPAAQIVITTYALLRLDAEELGAHSWDTLVLDEAQTIKNPASQSARAAHQLARRNPTAFRIALSGTPIENRLDDLWSQFEFACPGLLGSRAEFGRELGTRVSEIRRRTQPFVLRRLKREVARELPPRTEITLQCELSERERDLYDSVLAATRAQALSQSEEAPTPSAFAVLEALLRLRQACCHPALVPGSDWGAGTSSKLRLLLESLTAGAASGHRALVFSQWTGFLDLVEPELAKAGLQHLRLDGSTQDRASVVERFQRPDGPPVMLVSLKAGGTGLTLTAADHVYLLDPWWNPATENQAADRAHRIGQENPVLVHRLVARDTVEERVLQLQARKAELASEVLDGTGAAASLTRQELLELLG